MYRRIIDEVTVVARERDIDLQTEVVADWMEFARGLDPESYSLLHYDLTHDKRLELEVLHGSVVRHASKMGVDVPMNEAVYALLRPWADRAEAYDETP